MRTTSRSSWRFRCVCSDSHVVQGTCTPYKGDAAASGAHTATHHGLRATSGLLRCAEWTELWPGGRAKVWSGPNSDTCTASQSQQAQLCFCFELSAASAAWKGRVHRVNVSNVFDDRRGQRPRPSGPARCSSTAGPYWLRLCWWCWQRACVAVRRQVSSSSSMQGVDQVTCGTSDPPTPRCIPGMHSRPVHALKCHQSMTIKCRQACNQLIHQRQHSTA